MKTVPRNRDSASNSRVSELLSAIKGDVDTTSEMIKLGVSTDLAARLEKLIVNPIDALLDTYGSLFNQLKGTMNEITLEYFKNHKDFIHKVFNVSKDTDLTYYIVLRDDTHENRDVFFEFLSQYETLGFQQKIPVFIKFLPERVLEKSKLQNEIILN